MKKARLIYDLCTPTRERRPTCGQDIEDDIKIEDFTNEDDLKEALLQISWDDDEELAEYLDKNPATENLTLSDYIEGAIKYLDDPSDGSPNILYLSIDGVADDRVYPYDEMAGLDLENISKDELVRVLTGELVDDEED